MAYITESSPLAFFSELISKLKSAKDKAANERKQKEMNKNYIRGSISEYTKDLIMTFPTMVDNSLPPETASMISKATERNVVSMLRMLFASMQIKGTDGAEILSRIHKNINSSLSLDDYVDIFDDIQHMKKYYNENSYEYKLGSKIIEEAWRSRRVKSFPLSSFNERSLNGYMVKRNNLRKTMAVREADESYLKAILEDDSNDNDNNKKDSKLAKWQIERLQQQVRLDEPEELRISHGGKSNWELDYDLRRQIHADDVNQKGEDLYLRRQIHADDMEAKNKQFIHQISNDAEKLELERQRFAQQQATDRMRTEEALARHELSKKEYDLRVKELDARQKQFDKNYELAKKEYELKAKKQKFDMDRETLQDKYRIQQYKDQHKAAAVDIFSKQLLDQDVKKCNELTPTLLTVTYNTLDTDGSLYDQKVFIAGVKSRIISVDAADIIERLVAKNKTKVSFLNFIRATTGEISFVKDFLLCTKQAKIDAKNSVKKGPAAKLWKVLENRSIKNNWNKLNRKGNDASSITTLVINQETVNMMKKEFDFNLENIRNTRLIMDAYNLLAIVICDESIEVAKFFYAGNDMYEQQAYSSLEKEAKDNSYKKVINLIGQMNGR